MISGFDHVVIAVRDLKVGVAAYEVLLGCKADSISEKDDVAIAQFTTRNIAVELIAPVGPGAARWRAALDDGGEGLKSLVFAVDDSEYAHRRCGRLGLSPEPIQNREDGDVQSWRSFRANTERTHGVRLFFMQRETPPMREHANGFGLDHVVIRTSDLERAAALYGARLGLDMRLDRELRGRRLMFFRCGDAIVEIAHAPKLAKDDLWGLSWRAPDAAQERERLANAGLDVSEVRDGMKLGTRVFTVRSGTCGAPTLVLEAAPRRD